MEGVQKILPSCETGRCRPGHRRETATAGRSLTPPGTGCNRGMGRGWNRSLSLLGVRERKRELGSPRTEPGLEHPPAGDGLEPGPGLSWSRSLSPPSPGTGVEVELRTGAGMGVHPSGPGASMMLEPIIGIPEHSRGWSITPPGTGTEAGMGLYPSAPASGMGLEPKLGTGLGPHPADPGSEPGLEHHPAGIAPRRGCATSPCVTGPRLRGEPGPLPAETPSQVAVPRGGGSGRSLRTLAPRRGMGAVAGPGLRRGRAVRARRRRGRAGPC